MKKLLFAAIWLCVSAAIFGLSYGWLRLDLWMNPWLREMDFEWIYMITTSHGITLLYLRDSAQAFLCLGAIAFLFGGITIISFLLGDG